jgi:hypothetical protein
MSGWARVESIESLKEFRVSLCKFAETVELGLSEADADIRRTAAWLKQDQLGYWKGQVFKRGERVTQAKLALKRKQHQKTPLGGRYSCVDEEKALALAKQRLAEAEQKLANVRRWTRRLEREASLYKGQVQGLSFGVERDVPEGEAPDKQRAGDIGPGDEAGTHSTSERERDERP